MPGQPLLRKSLPVQVVTIHIEVGVPSLVGKFLSGYWQWLIGTAVAIVAVVVVVVVFFH